MTFSSSKSLEMEIKWFNSVKNLTISTTLTPSNTFVRKTTAGLATAIQAGKDSGVVLATIKTNKQKHPSSLDTGFMDGVINGLFLDHYIVVNPENNDQLELILGFAKRAGFVGGVVVDFSPQYFVRNSMNGGNGKEISRYKDLDCSRNSVNGGLSRWLKGSFHLLHFMEGRRFLDTKILTVEEEDKKQSMFTGLHKLKGMIYKENYVAINRKSSKRQPPTLFRNTGNQTMVFL
ncbi:hypothetical protein C5167_005429 [Papaver somniferum]|uniref:Uncharacterized protein n=1 Tax=Papaver somniferum TaxID=3469 RepID=A0A4Y7JAG0_PAPSO|nr:hypothetical protein C5167_005429 [Papaver somniferum]